MYDNQKPEFPANSTLQKRRLLTLPRQITPLHIAILLFVFIAAILLVISLGRLFHKNPFGEQIEINNFSQYYRDVPDTTRDAIFNTLYNIVANNNSNTKLPKSGAKIRKDSAVKNYDQKTKIYSNSFIVDIEKLLQTYIIQFIWSPDSDNPNLSGFGYPLVAVCPTKDQLIYPPFDCVDMFSDNNTAETFLFSILPIKVAYYENNYSVYVAYDIVTQIEDNKITIVINDKTGGNHEAALNKLKEKGLSLSSYPIVYNDLSIEQTPARAPNDARI